MAVLLRRKSFSTSVRYSFIATSHAYAFIVQLELSAMIIKMRLSENPDTPHSVPSVLLISLLKLPILISSKTFALLLFSLFRNLLCIF